MAVTSPDGIRDVLGRTDASSERCIIHDEVRNMAGDSLFVLPDESWLPRKRALQPVFTKHNVRNFGGQMSRAAETFVDRWRDGGAVDLDVECRRLTMQSLGRSVLGVDLNERADVIAEHMHVASSYTADRALRPVRAPRWLPTPARRRARAAVSGDAQGDERDAAGLPCRSHLDAPLVHALIAATDPETGQALSDDDICNDLLIFMLAGHDTTATALTYALWALGHHRDIQDRVAAEVAAIGDRELTPDDVPRLGYTVQVLARGAQIAAARRRCRAIGASRHRGRWIPRRGGQHHGRGNLRPASGSGPVGPTAGLRSRAVQSGDLQRPRPLAIRPVHRGTAPCIGEHFAMLETTLALATIVRSLEIRSVDEDFPVEVPFTTVADGPIRADRAPRELDALEQHRLFERQPREDRPPSGPSPTAPLGPSASPADRSARTSCRSAAFARRRPTSMFFSQSRLGP